MFNFNEKIDFKDKENDILTIGEILVDMITADYSEDFECDSYNKFFGGSPANIAMNCKRLGINSLIASAVGDDGLGRFLTNHLKKADINTEFIQKVDYSTSMVLVTKSKTSPVPIFYREADYHLDYNKYLEKALNNSKIVHFSCWPISKKPSRLTVEKILEEARKNEVLICFDPNYHPMIWEKGEDGIEYIKSIIGQVDIIKPSEDDAERLFGRDSHENQIKKFLKLGVKLVIMTLGAEGVLISNGNETIKLDTLAKDIVDTTGAGDAFWSGFYSGIIKGYSIREALDLGLGVSAYKLKFTGAVVELPVLEEIKKLYNL
ncbi:carbohydrate kinase family protein [Clostridium intestinale]|uniref:Fructokinase n=1 Tax=Clostridium intestinale URNW TaxID=1294142 RepID=U2N3P4_9CLOT|nr:sugar kinase [Clostridium intestinale]ERK30107.1 fructokinase [Clostridium intestinale URNW]